MGVKILANDVPKKNANEDVEDDAVFGNLM